MNIIINQSNLQTALRAVERLVAKNISLPILNTIRLKTETGRLELSATNLEMGINYWVPAKINQAGEVAVPARVFSDFITNIPDEKLAISTDQNIITVSSNRHQTQILGLDSKEFPLMPKTKKTDAITIPGPLLRSAIANVIDCVATSETRPELSGIFINISPKKTEFAATDSFRLAEKIVDFGHTDERSIILPRAAALELMRLSEENGGELRLTLAENQIFAHGENFEFVSRLIDGRYPDYKKIIPEKFISLAKVSKNELEINTKLASIFTSSVADIKITAGAGTLQLQAKNSDRGEIVASVACTLKNEPFTVSVNYRYLLDGLKTINSDSVIIQFTGEGSPLVLRASEGKDQTYLIMPLRS